MSKVRFAWVAFAALFLAACLPVSTRSPLGTTAGLGQDKALIGSWKVIPTDKSSEDEPGFLHFLLDDGAMTGLLISTGKPGGDGEWSIYGISTATLGGHAYLNARIVSENGKAASPDETDRTIPLLYRAQQDGSIAFYLINEDAAKAAVKAGRIEGQVGEGSMGDVLITAAPEALDKFFASDEGVRLFREKLMVLRKVE
jgi:hypothetical protein